MELLRLTSSQASDTQGRLALGTRARKSTPPSRTGTESNFHPPGSQPERNAWVSPKCRKVRKPQLVLGYLKKIKVSAGLAESQACPGCFVG